MEPVTTWTREVVCSYLRGLDPSLQHYPFQEWDVVGHDLLGMSHQHLDALGVRSIGHQELILEAVEQLCALHYELHSENLRSLTDKLFSVSQSLCSHILSLRKVSSHSPANVLSPTLKQLVCIIDIVSAARGLFSWLNRYLFTRMNDYSASRDIIALCIELADNFHEDWSDAEIQNKILLICQSICGICTSILNYSPESLLSQTATLETVRISPEQPECKLGIDIKSTSSGQHFVCKTTPESPAGRCDKILPGDELIKVNEQVVVGWTRQNLVWKLLEKSDCVTLVLKKVSVLSPDQSPVATTSQTHHRLSSPLQAFIGHTLPCASEKTPSKKNCWTPSLKIQRGATCSVTAHSEPSTPLGGEVPTLKQANSAPTSPITSPYSPLHLILLNSSSSPLNTSESCSTPYPQCNSHLPATTQIESVTTYPSALSAHQEQKITPPSNTTQYIARSRSGSVTSPTASVLSPPQSPAALRLAVSDSNLFSSTNPASSPQKKCQSDEGSSKSVTPDQASVANSPEGVKKLHVSSRRIQTQQIKKSSFSKRNQKGVVTKLSRRRVSCRDLGTPDCDGWLWKRKENVSFMSQRWKHCWCVLKGDRLYWYNAPQDEKALGLVNVSSYKLESTRESKPKKKYEFQLCHTAYKPFVFAADNLDDMNKWVTCLVKILQKYKAPPSVKHPPEEECYSETEAEEQDDDQPRAQELLTMIPISIPMHQETKSAVQSPTKNAKSPKSSTPQTESMTTGAGPDLKQGDTQPEGDELRLMMTCLQQGGVSLIGKKTTMTQDEYRKSFIRRNKNPDINRKAHTLRVLQSTLKAKLLELDALNQVLENPNLNSAKFHQWKYEHEQLYETMGRGLRARASLGNFMSNLDKERREKSKGRDESESSD
ncbi:connector enhancer of kinase suppressor of ras 1 [Pelodytes ibericus]